MEWKSPELKPPGKGFKKSSKNKKNKNFQVEAQFYDTLWI